ncbi:SpvB/TcaC N-terminal domain-containing protein [Salinimicrobium gaetbulicola]|uniref:SpvB/TcaC N-terminal domain-containing protein n=1 Tax=Salinimicrobium gaetbulicola TaxID=999702 RepID=A0ABW3ICL4_9FLAO
MNKKLLSLSLFLLISLAFFASSTKSEFIPKKDITSKEAARYYGAELKEGIIGVDKDHPIDSPSDNVFTIVLDEAPAENDEVWLTYELYGVCDHTGISRSINDQLAVGGHFVTLNDGWQNQSEQLKGTWLKKGENIIRFTLPENAAYSYRIKNLGIKIEKSGEAQRDLVINRSHPEEYLNGFGYLKGFVEGKGSNEARIYVDGVEVSSQFSEFESLVQKPSGKGSWESEVKVVFSDGEVITKKLSFKKPVEADIQNSIAGYKLIKMEKSYLPSEAFNLALQQASISIPLQALPVKEQISITALREVDIPALEGTMVNVTKTHSGFRFLPHGTKFDKEATIALEYDLDKIPDGYTVDDIKTYYFDEEVKNWVALKKDSLNPEKNQILSQTTHFTDMINGIIKVPESPETAGFVPTSMSDIKAANPAAAVNTINPPSANSMGSANMQYPIELPAGRQGLQPQLAVQYNSGGGNDWLGLGWNLATPSITVDTRWGVPRYLEDVETETYSMSGEQLAPIAHRGEPVARSAEKQFYPRVEGGFKKIIRHGDKPYNHWWEVTSKSGTKYFYGGTPGKGIVETSVLKDTDGNIAHWALVEIRDLNDNFVSYQHVKVQDTGLKGGTVPGYNLYVSRITYTGHGSEEGKYEVLFTRDRQLGEAKRADVSINARYGFKQVTADLLRKIEVRYNGKNIRSYELTYRQGAFFKTLLEKITQYDAKGTEFNSHEFEYYDDVKSGEGYTPYTSVETWNPQRDDVRGEFINPIPGFNDDASTLSGTKSSNETVGLAVTAGLPGKVGKLLTMGAKLGYTHSESEGMLALVDINGDNLPDKVFKQGSKLVYRMNLSGPNGKPVFGEELPITGISDFSKSKTGTFNKGLEAHPPVGFIGYDNSQTETKEEVYFSDVNGDRLIDIVSKGTVYFNHLDEDGSPVFTRSSKDTPSYILAEAGIDTSTFQVDPDELEKKIDQFPLHDVVRVWQAPYDGTIDVTGQVNLMAPLNPSGTADGVRVAVQHNGTELWNSTIAADDHTSKTPTGLSSISIKKGEKIYFRVQSVFDGTNDEVSWNPTITYRNHTDLESDANNRPLYRFNAEEDYVVTAKQYVEAPIDGSVNFEGTFVKPVTSDDLTVRVFNHSTGAAVKELTFPAAETVNEEISFSKEVAKGDTFIFEVLSDSNIDWPVIHWQPSMYYTSSSDPDYPKVIGEKGAHLIEFSPVVHYSMYASEYHKTTVFEAQKEDTLSITPHFKADQNYSGKINFSVKKVNELVGKNKMTVIYGAVSDSVVSPVVVPVAEGDRLFVEYHTASIDLAKYNRDARAIIAYQSGAESDTISAGLYAVNENPDLGPLYRGWGQFGYNGNRERANQPINESELQINKEELEGLDPEEIQNPDDLNGGYDPTKDNFIPFVPSAEDQWRGYDNLTYIKAASMSASRLGEDDIRLFSPFNGDNSHSYGAVGIVKFSKSEVNSVALGGGVGPANASASKSWGSSESISDFMDMNGDSYPDIVTEDYIQYTTPRGGLDNEAKLYTAGNHRSEFEAEGFTLGGSYVRAKGNNTGDSQQAEASTNTDEAGKDAQSSIGISANFAENDDEVKNSWMDVNGDGLPDKVYQGGEVELNLGYSFAPKEQWGYSQVGSGSSVDQGGGLGINLNNGSFSAGISLSRTDNKSDVALQDINGDGLVDILRREKTNLVSPGILKVNLNTGNGFAREINWLGAEAINKGVSTGESVNAAFSYCFVIPIITVKMCVNPSAAAGQGVSRSWQQISDIDGDGFPDVLKSNKADELVVQRSTIGRTNLLKEVKRPLRATFTVDYKRTGNTYGQPSDLWALSKVEVHDGVEGDGADTMASSFEYEEGYYDRHERDFYGFKTVKSHQLDTENENEVYRTVVQEFDTGNYYEKGVLLREVLQDADENLYTETINTYTLKDVQTGAVLDDSYAKNDTGMAFPALTETLKNFYEGNSSPGKSTRTAFEYDVYGNVTSYTDYGEPDDDSDDIVSNISYHSYPGKHLIGVPKQITVSGGGETLRKRATDIDAGTGNIIQIRQYLEDGKAATFDMEYDMYGNLTKITRPENAEGDRMFFEYTYDPEVHTYTTGITDAYGYSSSSEYDYRFGQVLQTTDLNEQQMRFEIDDLGRITKVTGPMELAMGVPYTIVFEYHPEAEVPWASTRHYDPAHKDNDLETVTFMDGLKRSLQVKKDGAKFTGPSSADTEIMIVSGRTVFDAFGRTVESYYPVEGKKGDEGSFIEGEDDVPPTKTTYDVMDRTLTVTLPDNAVTKTEYGFGTDRDGNTQFSTKVTDANGIWKESFTNVRGLNTAVLSQYSQGSDIWTSFSFNAINELIEVKDDQDNLTKSTYDWLGRRTEVVQPNAGTTTFEYDLSGNMTKKVTANLAAIKKAITYEYDYGRLIHIKYPENPQNNVTYTYGEPGAKHYRAGRMVLQEDATGAQEFFYNQLGAVTKNIRTIVVPDGEILTFSTEWEYDTWNRITKMIYPDKETLEYNYNLGGLLHSFGGKKQGTDYSYVKQLGYDKFEQRVYLGYGNGTETFYEYEPDRRRLKNLIAETASDRKMMDNVYTYDNVNNILRLQNKAEIPESNLMGGQTDYNYEYDDLYRLTGATGSHLGSDHENRYSLKMRYNSVHSIVKKEQVHRFKGYDETEWSPRNKTTYTFDYEYGESQPHAPVHIGEQTYTYDANGNQTGWTHDTSGQEREIIWDEENRIKGIADNGEINNYVYDAAGERVLKSHGGGQNVRVNGKNAGGQGSIGNYTIYVNPYVVVRNSMITKHFYIGSQRVTTKLAESSDGLLQELAGGTDTRKIDYANKQKQSKASIIKLYADLGLDVTVFAGNSGQTPSGYAWGLLNGHNPGGKPSAGSGPNTGSGGNGKDVEAFVYYYHPDHLGSSSYITDANGEVSQHVEYFAFGETFLEEHSNTDRTPYLFNGKELDEETGLYYYGARYYDARTSVWQSVDPLAQKYPDVSPYAYVANNPLKYIDPDGRKLVYAEENSVLFNLGIKLRVFFQSVFGNKEVRSTIKFLKQTDKEIIISNKSGSIEGSSTKPKALTDYKDENTTTLPNVPDFLNRNEDEITAYYEAMSNYEKNMPKNHQTKGVGDDSYLNLDFKSNLKEDKDYKNNKNTIMMHEFYHAERIAKGLVTDRKTEEIKASQFVNKNMRNSNNRRENYNDWSIPKEK